MRNAKIPEAVDSTATTDTVYLLERQENERTYEAVGSRHVDSFGHGRPRRLNVKTKTPAAFTLLGTAPLNMRHVVLHRVKLTIPTTSCYQIYQYRRKKDTKYHQRNGISQQAAFHLYDQNDAS